MAQQTTTIIGNTSTDANGKYIYVGYDGPGLKDSVQIQNNQFNYSISITEPINFYLCKDRNFFYSEKDIVIFYIEPGTIEFDFDFDDLSTIKIQGVKTETEAQELRASKIPLSKLFVENNTILSELYKNKETEKEVEKKKALQTEINKYEKISDSLKLEFGKISLAFANSHPKSYLAPEQLYYALTRNGSSIYFDDIKLAFENLDDEIKNSSKSEELKLGIENFAKSQVGVQAPEFEMKELNGEIVKLEDFRGKYVLLDFWASWCKPCLEDLPHIKELHQKYKSEGLEIIGISEDKNVQKWKDAIEKFELSAWKQFSIEQNQSSVKSDYFVNVIPIKVLIDPTGKIIHRWRGGGEPNQLELEQVLLNIFKH